MTIAKFIKLEPKTKHAKDRIHQHGEIWEIYKEFKDTFIIKSLENTFHGAKDSRSIHKKDDKNFIYTFICKECLKNESIEKSDMCQPCILYEYLP